MQLFHEKVDQRGNNSRRNNLKNISNYYSRNHLKSHLAGTFLGKSLTKCTFFCIYHKSKMATTAGYILTYRTYNVKINKMFFETDVIEHMNNILTFI
jgi:hypothetical protein